MADKIGPSYCSIAFGETVPWPAPFLSFPRVVPRPVGRLREGSASRSSFFKPSSRESGASRKGDQPSHQGRGELHKRNPPDVNCGTHVSAADRTELSICLATS